MSFYRHENPVGNHDYTRVSNFYYIHYIATHKRKATINILSRNTAPKTQRVEPSQHTKRNQ